MLCLHHRWLWWGFITILAIIISDKPAHPNLYMVVTWTVIAGDVTARNTDERVFDSSDISNAILYCCFGHNLFPEFGLFLLEISNALILII